jgi:hypothetical protein
MLSVAVDGERMATTNATKQASAESQMTARVRVNNGPSASIFVLDLWRRHVPTS